jgi:hypothetical protein
MERYLYFTNPNDTGAPNANAEVALYPTSAVTAIFAASLTTTTINFVPRDGAGTAEVVSDKENSVFNISGVTACAITSAD